MGELGLLKLITLGDVITLPFGFFATWFFGIYMIYLQQQYIKKLYNASNSVESLGKYCQKFLESFLKFHVIIICL